MPINADNPFAELAADFARGRRKPDDLLPLVYDELRRVARQQLGRLAPGNSFQPTALVHEAYLRLVGKDMRWEGARHFFFAAARAMHDILVERARQRSSQKRGGGRARLELDRLVIAYESPGAELLALADALSALERLDPRKHQVVMLRFFAGCTEVETAVALEVSTATVAREWRFARAWLHERLNEPPIPPLT